MAQSGWGPAESGERLFERDTIYRQEKALEAQKMMGEIAMQPDTARLRRSQADLAGARAEQEQLENQAARQLQEKVRGATLDTDPRKRLLQLSTLAGEAGDLKRSSEMLEEVGKLDLKTAQAENQIASAQKAQIEAAVKQQDFISNNVAGTRSQADLNAFNSRYEQQFQEPSPFRGRVWTPTLAKQAEMSAVSAKDRLKLEMDRIEEGGRNARAQRANELTREANRIAEMRAEAAVKTAEARAKAGGGGDTVPFRDRSMETTRILKQQFPSLDDEHARLASFDVVSGASALRRQNSALGLSEAIHQTINTFKEAGVFKEGEGVFDRRGTLKRYDPARSGISSAQPIPLDGSPEDYKDTLKKNLYYRTRRGLFQWNGTRGIPVEEVEQ